MQRGLDGRRIALTAIGSGDAPGIEVVRAEFARAGAEVELLGANEDASRWQGGQYAGLVILAPPGFPGGSGASADSRLVQLVREFLVSEKPVAAVGPAVGVVIQAGGAAGRSLTVDEGDRAAVEGAGGRVVEDDLHADGCLLSARATADMAAFATAVTRQFAKLLEEGDVDSLSDQSFPASDPPSTSPSVSGSAKPTPEPTRP